MSSKSVYCAHRRAYSIAVVSAVASGAELEAYFAASNWLIQGKQRAEERTRTADLISSYELACARSSLS